MYALENSSIALESTDVASSGSVNISRPRRAFLTAAGGLFAGSTCVHELRGTRDMGRSMAWDSDTTVQIIRTTLIRWRNSVSDSRTQPASHICQFALHTGGYTSDVASSPGCLHERARSYGPTGLGDWKTSGCPRRVRGQHRGLRTPAAVLGHGRDTTEGPAATYRLVGGLEESDQTPAWMRRRE